MQLLQLSPSFATMKPGDRKVYGDKISLSPYLEDQVSGEQDLTAIKAEAHIHRGKRIKRGFDTTHKALIRRLAAMEKAKRGTGERAYKKALGKFKLNADRVEKNDSWIGYNRFKMETGKVPMDPAEYTKLLFEGGYRLRPYNPYTDSPQAQTGKDDWGYQEKKSGADAEDSAIRMNTTIEKWWVNTAEDELVAQVSGEESEDEKINYEAQGVNATWITIKDTRYYRVVEAVGLQQPDKTFSLLDEALSQGECTLEDYKRVYDFLVLENLRSDYEEGHIDKDALLRYAMEKGCHEEVTREVNSWGNSIRAEQLSAQYQKEAVQDRLDDNYNAPDDDTSFQVPPAVERRIWIWLRSEREWFTPSQGWVSFDEHTSDAYAPKGLIAPQVREYLATVLEAAMAGCTDQLERKACFQLVQTQPAGFKQAVIWKSLNQLADMLRANAGMSTPYWTLKASERAELQAGESLADEQSLLASAEFLFND